MAPKVLLLDDDERFRQPLVNALERFGLSVVQAARARDATELMLSVRPGLAIVDGLLPDANGVGWIAEQRGAGVTIPMVFVSAFWRDLDTYKMLTQRLGVALVMHKPLDVEQLAERVGVLLRTRAPKSSRPRMSAAVSPSPELAMAYAEQLPERLGALQAALDAHEANPDDDDTRAILRGVAHEIRGTAGSFGYPEVSDLAARIEDALTASGPAAEGRLPAELRSMLWTVRAGALPLSSTPAPAIEAPGEPDREPDPPSQPRSPPLRIIDRPRVLLVDDDTMFLEHALDTADAQLMEVVAAESVDEALARALTDRIDVAFVGLPLGEPDRSISLITALRQSHPQTPVGVIALDDSLQARVDAVDAGASLFVSHPVDARVLARAVARLRAQLGANANRPLCLAVVTDDEIVADRLFSLERSTFDVQILGREALMRSLERARPDAIVIDARIGGGAGANLCRVLRASRRFHEEPVLLLTSTSDEAERRAALAAGADDCISGLDAPTAWAERIELAVRAAWRRTGERPDAVTRLPGRAEVLLELNARLSEAKRHRRPLAVALLDVDDLSRINDEHGRAVGDRLLGAVADLMRGRFRVEDVRGRLGRDELVMGFAGTDGSISEVLLRSRAEFGALALSSRGGDRVHGSFSIGVASYPEDGDSLAWLLAVAEDRLRIDRERPS